MGSTIAGLPATPLTLGARPMDFSGTSEYGVYAVETTQRHAFGRRTLTWDGRVFKYSKSHDACDTYKANVFFNAWPATGITFAAIAQDADAGAISVVLDNGATVAQTLNGLAGGTIYFHGGDNATVQIRTIIGNSVAAKSAECTIYLDAPLTADITAAVWYARCMPSPYSAITKTDIAAIEGSTGKGRVSFCGYAAAAVNAANLCHWEQTYGPIAASVYGSEVGKTQYHRDVVFRYDGNLMHRTAGAGDEHQRAGFIMDNNAADNGGKFFMLQISI